MTQILVGDHGPHTVTIINEFSEGQPRPDSEPDAIAALDAVYVEKIAERTWAKAGSGYLRRYRLSSTYLRIV
jgi:hypothetical protein